MKGKVGGRGDAGVFANVPRIWEKKEKEEEDTRLL